MTSTRTEPIRCLSPFDRGSVIMAAGSNYSVDLSAETEAIVVVCSVSSDVKD
jgi:hypothetical protein